jgi:hypothetical protein
MNPINKFARVFSTLLLTIFLNSCDDPLKTALETNDRDQARIAVSKIIDQTSLEKIALEAKEAFARDYAIDKLTNQFVLAEIILKDDEVYIPNSTVLKITDSALLVKVTLESRDEEVRRVTVKKLTDPITLSKLAFNDKDSMVRILSLTQLLQPNILIMLADRKEDTVAQVMYKILNGFRHLNTLHRERLIISVIPAIKFLLEPEVFKKTGEIISISTDWQRDYQFYNLKKEPVDGERFSCEIKLKNISNPLSFLWFTNFPELVGSGAEFIGADINAGDLLKDIMKLFSQGQLKKYALTHKNWQIRYAATDRLTDQKLLVKIVMENNNEKIRNKAIDRLTDLNLLTKLALETRDYSTAWLVIQKLIPHQNILAKIALEVSGYNQDMAIEKITNKKLLEKIIKETNDSNIRSFAEKQIDNLPRF